MKKIGIATIVKVDNYGAELQAYATQRKLLLLGYDAEIIDYRYYKSWNFKDSKMSAPLIPMSIKGKVAYWLKYRLINALVECIMPLFVKPVKNRIARFKIFHQKNTKFSRLFKSMDELYRNPPEYDVYMTGSDQVWSPEASSSIEPYFLTFASRNAVRISYAASFGVCEICESLKERFGKWLNTYDSISVREENGIELVKKLSGKNAVWVVDPTFLLSRDEWMNVAEPYPDMPEHYVLIYNLSDSRLIDQLGIRIGKKYNIPVFRLCKRAYGIKKVKGIKNILDAGPAEFLSLIANTNYVVTDSFHGTAFSINLGVPFFTVISGKKKDNSRMESLLELVELRKCLVLDDASVESIDIEQSIDFNKAYSLLNEARMKSIDYLKKALS